MRAILLALALIGSPALADALPTQPVPDTGRLRFLSSATPAPAGWRTPTPPVVATKADAEGTRYSDQDVRVGFLPVLVGYRRSGGGLVRVWNGAPAGFRTPGVDAPATITTLISQLPEPPSPPDPPAPPTPPDPGDDVPGPLGLGALAAGWHFSRQLRRRIRG